MRYRRTFGLIIIDTILLTLHFIWKVLTLENLRIKKKNIDESKKILIVDFGFLGDTIISLPAIKSIRNKYPDAQIDIIINSKFKEIWEYNKYYTNLIDFDILWSRYNKRFHIRDLFNYLKTILEIRKQKYDLAIDLRGDIRNIFFLIYMSNANNRVGFDITGGNYFLTNVVEFPFKNEVENNLAIAKSLGGKEESYDYKISKKEEEEVNKLIKEKGIKRNFILLFPSSGYKAKEWQSDRWAEFIDKTHSQIVMAGTEKDEEKILKISRLTKKQTINLIGDLSINELAALIKKSKLVIGCDSGPLHLTSALNKTSIVLFGPTDEERWSPYQNSDVIKKDCPPEYCNPNFNKNIEHPTMRLIEVKDLINKVKEVLK